MSKPHTSSSSALEAVPATLVLSPLDRAAITLLSMGEAGAAGVLRCLSRDELLDVTQAMARMQGVKVDEVQSTLSDFFDLFRTQSSVRGASRQFLRKSLDLALGEQLAGSVLNHIYGDAIESKFNRLHWAQPQWLSQQLSREHVRMQALFLSLLPPVQSSEVIRLMPRERADLVLLQIAALREIDHELLIDLETVVDSCLERLSTQSTRVQGVQQAADIINHLPTSRAQLLQDLRELDAQVIAEVESCMYNFAILAVQSDATIGVLLEAVDDQQWAIALKGADPVITAALTRAMPRRQVQAFEDALMRMPAVAVSQIEQAREEIVALMRELEADGVITLVLQAEATL